jgi:hypothetical protein
MNECIRSIEVGERSGPNQVDYSGFQIDLNGSRDVFVIGCFGEVDID